MRISRGIFSRTMVLAAAFCFPSATSTVLAQPAKVKLAAPSVASLSPVSDEELDTLRAQLVALIHMSPTLQRVVETDPTVLADQDYVSRNNPQLAAFLTQHPEITRNPDFYLFANFPRSRNFPRVEPLRRRVNGDDTPSWEQIQQQGRREVMINISQVVVFLVVIGALIWLIRILLESRRWNRVFRLQSEVHAKLIDRFATNQELLHYMETEPGKRFLEAAPIPVGVDRRQPLPGGIARILAPLQIGIVLTLLGIGLIVLQRRIPDTAPALLIFGMVAFMPGLGFIISSLVTWRISARLGLLPQSPAESPDRQ